ncbi:helix-turn-helix domain-containing protein [Luteimonas sp. 3794]|uniref:helix-turn-helix domain-containing protein n=1 Tax=Luteimonas sp. 3794 TaxID=2817730 RepID=UPI0028596095|nr:helix-turn-helix domain-containing protein [Luteimonas sp. 3794]MDR6990978.1 transcriptional regulator with XRE-family HTH domain [Luteimonas sp. 3794]
MQIKLETAGEIGQWIRAVRKSQGMRQDDLAALVGASHVFLGDVERGKESVQWGRLFAVLRELGIEIRVDLPLDLPPEAGSP